MLLVVGGSGFIGSNFILRNINRTKIINFDALTYAGNPENLSTCAQHENYFFEHGSICDAELVQDIVNKYKPDAIINFAAESHVDRSIRDPSRFIETNITGTFNLLQASLTYWRSLEKPESNNFRFFQVSTDEVFGSLGKNDPPFTEESNYEPNSPYSASKASGDHLVRSFFQTYGLPTLISNCSNNYGPFQFPEKLIPLVIHCCEQRKAIPVYGDGKQIRDWIFVSDHCSALEKVLADGDPGEVYLVGGNEEKTNLGVISAICAFFDEQRPQTDFSYSDLITFVDDRPGHDRRYAVSSAKTNRALGWVALETFATGLAKTVNWYLEHPKWVENVVSEEYRGWVEEQYG